MGAGFSKWATNLPLGSELFDFNIQSWGQREEKRLERVRNLKQNWDKDHPGGLSEKFIAEALLYPKRDKDIVIWYVVRRLSEPFIWKDLVYGKRHVLMIDENRRHDIEGIVKATNFLKNCLRHQLVGIITTNYDMIPEYAFGTKGFNYGKIGETLTGRGPYPVSQWIRPIILQGKIPIAKLHGSINWDTTAKYTEGRRGITGNALIIPPAPEKEPGGILKPHWSLADNILRKSTRLLVFGFGFNRYDEAVKALLKNSGSNIKSVLLINRNSREAEARELWPSAKIEWCQPPPMGESKISYWSSQS